MPPAAILAICQIKAMRIFLPDALTDADLDAAIEVLRRKDLQVRGVALLTRDDRVTGGILLMADSDAPKALCANPSRHPGISLRCLSHRPEGVTVVHKARSTTSASLLAG